MRQFLPFGEALAVVLAVVALPLLGRQRCAAAFGPGRVNHSRSRPSGVWIQHGSIGSHGVGPGTPFVMGGDVGAAWRDLEPTRGVWNWTALDRTCSSSPLIAQWRKPRLCGLDRRYAGTA